MSLVKVSLSADKIEELIKNEIARVNQDIEEYQELLSELQSKGEEVAKFTFFLVTLFTIAFWNFSYNYAFPH